MKWFLVCLPAMFLINCVLAGNCEIHVTRTACPGKEDVSYKKCNGKQSCTENEDAATPEQCASIAMQACANARFSITKSKVITAKFDGKDIASKTGKTDFCLEYENRASEFDQCDKK